MGDLRVTTGREDTSLRNFTRCLIRDMRVLEHMLNEQMFETGVRRIGAEQEIFLVDSHFQPASINEQVMERDQSERFVPELAQFNLEANLDPMLFGGSCLRTLEANLTEVLSLATAILDDMKAHAVLVGILPTILVSDLSIDNLTPRKRYYALNDAISRLRGGPGSFQIRGTDELFVKHDSIMIEGCNISFQTHFQVTPDEFARFYNIAQVVAAPVLAAATNSPLLFGKRLWRETRIALFQQAIDTRSSNLYLREMSPRVHFGSRWVEDSVLEIYREDIARFRVLFASDEDEDSWKLLAQGDVPRLIALMLHNGTVYRWNRACYGVTEGKPHLRIENRILPSGPTVVDEVANAAFWFGLVSGIAASYEDVREHILFDEAKHNFIAAARLGLGSQIKWLDGKRVPVDELILHELIPLARQGLVGSGINSEDADHYLGILFSRVKTRQTGSQWQLDSLANMKDQGSRSERLGSLVNAMIKNQKTGKPVHEWPLAELNRNALAVHPTNAKVEQYMETDLYTVSEEELVDLAVLLMNWQQIDYIPVEDRQHNFIGVISRSQLSKQLAPSEPPKQEKDLTSVAKVVRRDVTTVSPDTPMREALHIMRKNKIGVLPVVLNAQLVGIVTEKDLMRFAE